MRNVVLVGFMGTGKTRLAKILSEKLNMKYISTDGLIEEREKTTIADIFSAKGEAYFRKIEKQVIKDVSCVENAVIDTGGGAVMDSENLKNLKKNGVVVCLRTEPRIILERTKKYAHRPLLNVADPLEKIKKLLEIRKPFYEQADHHLNTSAMSAEEAAIAIQGIIKNA